MQNKLIFSDRYVKRQELKIIIGIISASVLLFSSVLMLVFYFYKNI